MKSSEKNVVSKKLKPSENVQSIFAQQAMVALFGEGANGFDGDIDLNSEALRNLLSQDPNNVNLPLDNRGITLLHIASFKGSIELFEVIKQFNPNPNLYSYTANKKPFPGDVALTMVVKELIRHNGEENYVRLMHELLSMSGVKTTNKSFGKHSAKMLILEWISGLKNEEASSELISKAEGILSNYNDVQYIAEFRNLITEYSELSLSIGFREYYSEFKVAGKKLIEWVQASKLGEYLSRPKYLELVFGYALSKGNSEIAGFLLDQMDEGARNSAHTYVQEKFPSYFDQLFCDGKLPAVASVEELPLIDENDAEDYRDEVVDNVSKLCASAASLISRVEVRSSNQTTPAVQSASSSGTKEGSNYAESGDNGGDGADGGGGGTKRAISIEESNENKERFFVFINMTSSFDKWKVKTKEQIEQEEMARFIKENSKKDIREGAEELNREVEFYEEQSPNATSYIQEKGSFVNFGEPAVLISQTFIGSNKNLLENDGHHIMGIVQ